MYNYSLRLSFTLSSCTACCIYHYFFVFLLIHFQFHAFHYVFSTLFFLSFSIQGLYFITETFSCLCIFFQISTYLCFFFFQFSMYWLIVKLTLYFCLLFSCNPYVIKCCLNKYPSPRDCGSRRYWRSTSIVVLSLTVLCWSDPLLFILKSTINRQ